MFTPVELAHVGSGFAAAVSKYVQVAGRSSARVRLKNDGVEGSPIFQPVNLIMKEGRPSRRACRDIAPRERAANPTLPVVKHCTMCIRSPGKEVGMGMQHAIAAVLSKTQVLCITPFARGEGATFSMVYGVDSLKQEVSSKDATSGCETP